MRRARPKWESEAAMCASFIEHATTLGWTAYPETGGFDILLVDAEGTQVGVEAKLHPNIAVLSQALDHGCARDGVGPHYRAVLVPHSPHEFRVVVAALKLDLFVWSPDQRDRRFRDRFRLAHRRATSRPVELPPVVPSFEAGAPSPKTLSPWRVDALKLCTKLRRGPVSGAVFKAHGMKASDWVARGYVRATGASDGRFGVYEIAPNPPPEFPDNGYEAERDALAEAARRPVLATEAGRLLAGPTEEPCT